MIEKHNKLILTPTGRGPSKDRLRLGVKNEGAQGLLRGQLHRSTVILLKRIDALLSFGRHFAPSSFDAPQEQPPNNKLLSLQYSTHGVISKSTGTHRDQFSPSTLWTNTLDEGYRAVYAPDPTNNRFCRQIRQN